jgi:hypothetical protein
LEELFRFFPSDGIVSEQEREAELNRLKPEKDDLERALDELKPERTATS